MFNGIVVLFGGRLLSKTVVTLQGDELGIKWEKRGGWSDIELIELTCEQAG